MENFEFYNPVRIFFGKGQISKISTQIPAGSRVMLLYGGAAFSGMVFMSR
jgi:NADP-dependent alcohol dehydrogenase